MKMEPRFNQESLLLENDCLTPRKLRREVRPNRQDLLRLLALGPPNVRAEAVCKGQCIYCDSDGGDSGDSGGDGAA